MIFHSPFTEAQARKIVQDIMERSGSEEVLRSPTIESWFGEWLAGNRARRQGLVSVNPAEAVELPEKNAVKRGVFTPAEVGMLVNAADGEWKTLIQVAYLTGQRLSDCVGMAWSDVDLAAGTWTLRQAKTKTELVVPLHPQLCSHLESLASVDTAPQFVMPGMAGKGPGGRHGLSESFKNIMRKAGVDNQPVRGGGVRMISKRSFHALRHSFTSALMNAGVAEELRMKLTGHKTAGVHRGYLIDLVTHRCPGPTVWRTKNTPPPV